MSAGHSLAEWQKREEREFRLQATFDKWMPRVLVALGVAMFIFCLVSCAGPKVRRTAEEVKIKTPPMSTVTIHVVNNELTVEVEPVPWWQAAIQGVAGGLAKAFSKDK